jgi:hypothetical protein
MIVVPMTRIVAVMVVIDETMTMNDTNELRTAFGIINKETFDLI